MCKHLSYWLLIACRMRVCGRRRLLVLLVTILSVAQGSGVHAATQVGAALRGRPALVHTEVAPARGASSLQFEANRGQSDAAVQFLAHGNGYTLFLTATEAVLSLAAPRRQAPSLVRLHYVDAQPGAPLTGVGTLPGLVNYYLGHDPARWHTGIPTYAQVKYTGLYPGIDLSFYGKGNQLEHDFIIAPGRDPGLITLAIQGADAVSLDRAGNLVMQVAGAELRLRRPLLYQEVAGRRHRVTGGYRLKDGNQVGFSVGNYDRNRPLIIDPVLVYSTFYGAENDENGYGIALDKDGFIYVTGSTNSAALPLTHPAQPEFGGGGIHCPSDEVPSRFCYDAFVLKLDPTGSSVVYATYFGDPGDDEGKAIAVDAAGNAYITGYISRNSEALPDFYIYKYVLAVKLDTQGALIYAASFGNNGSRGHAIAVDGDGNAYITGETASSGFPVTENAIQPERGELIDAFVSVLDPTGQTLTYSTYLGNNGEYCEECYSEGDGIAVDQTGLIYVTGQAAPSFPTTANAYQPTFQGLFWKAFVTQIDPQRAGTAGLLYSTLLGGEGSEFGRSIALDAAGKVYIAGVTQSWEFPATASAYDRTCGTDGLCNRPDSTSCDPDIPGLPPECSQDNIADAFVAKLDITQAGSAGLEFATYLGGRGKERANSIAVDGEGNVYVTGATFSADFPSVRPLQEEFGGGNYDAFVVKLSSDGSDLIYASLLGGGGDDEGYGLTVSGDGDAYVTGLTGSRAFPTSQPLFPRANRFDAFVSRIADTESPLPGGAQTFLPLIQR